MYILSQWISKKLKSPMLLNLKHNTNINNLKRVKQLLKDLLPKEYNKDLSKDYF